ncbi:ribonuclease III [Candidatus Nomurabacteria bacterium]|nr:ribonuclease III [Candidatus Nomurabacteria bacterium]USN94815.1 MAG: ribonuclease III [Candidatus Nomurabacteria bacterium]
MIDFTPFEEKIGIVFVNKSILTQAFIHRSYLNENPKLGLEHNERLEFLGDAVLELSVTDYLYKKYPDEDEGILTSYRAALVNAVIISDVATKLGMNDFMLLSKGEAKDTGKARSFILANAFEALIGAIYIDQGYEKADEFISKTILTLTDIVVKKKLWKDSKSFVQEKAQEFLSVTPSYQVLSESGPDHDKLFTVGVFFGEELAAEGKGKSKQEAEQKAAERALDDRGWRN